ncbi:MAG TPA: hypothetical protein VMD92_18890 [Acidobacteriaceae bacterium]|nr:hypothetical protein [Acidobacteriaceae bacterium]
MVAWLSGFAEFFGDMLRHWVGKMTGFLSIVLGVSPVVWPEFFAGDQGIVHNRWLWWAAAAVSFFIASRLAWDEQRKHRQEAEREREKAHERLMDQSPRIALDVLSPSSPGDWVPLMNSTPPPLFYLQHYGGDGARDVRVGPIVAPSGRRVLLFDPVNLVSGAIRRSVPFCVAMRDNNSVDSKVEKGESANQLLHFFLRDNPEHLPIVKYQVPLEWSWKDQIVRTVCELHFDTKREQLSVHHPRPQRSGD